MRNKENEYICGEGVKQLFEKNGKSVAWVADQIGITRESLYRCIRTEKMSKQCIDSICDLFGVSRMWLKGIILSGGESLTRESDLVNYSFKSIEDKLFIIFKDILFVYEKCPDFSENSWIYSSCDKEKIELVLNLCSHSKSAIVKRNFIVPQMILHLFNGCDETYELFNDYWNDIKDIPNTDPHEIITEDEDNG